MDESALREQADLEWLARYERESQQLRAQPLDEEVEEMCVEESQPVTCRAPSYSEHVAESRDFCARFFPTATLRAQQPQCRYEKLAGGGEYAPSHCGHSAYSAPPVVEPQHRKEIFYVKSDACAMQIQFQFANFVTVTYLGHALTGEDYAFNSHALINALLPYYPEFRKKKFAKVNLRLRDCGSHMIYNSGIIVESGSDCMRKSREMLRHLIWLLRHVCGCRHLVVQRRACFNIVATGNVRALAPDGQMRGQSLCLGVLKELFPAASYKKDKFQGIIIKLLDVEKHFAERAYHAGLSTQGDDEYEYAAEYDSEDDDAAVIAQINAECEEAVHAVPASAEACAKRNATLEDEFAQLGGKEENGTFLIFKEGQIICTGCKSKRRLLEAYDKIYALLAQCLPTPENLAAERRISGK